MEQEQGREVAYLRKRHGFVRWGALCAVRCALCSAGGKEQQQESKALAGSVMRALAVQPAPRNISSFTVSYGSRQLLLPAFS
jgi:hypothetical protein